ncbi:myb-like domain, Myb/SANT-like DNA-binding domain protein [Artemisia annua]|uniref:Myb-like domain, Myb/SANT-like DNA-binding domain protein n=1 Tax=Artemisia annua TaxID=35608 RepID=A0A2U1NJB2_ARTAN|nr:myb-like domain, Myb/SANT-like DNA-binding domain protein [Artemisia annua]
MDGGDLSLNEDVQVGKGNSKADKKNWTAIEEVALAKAWIHISTCKKVGNEQGRDKMWERILEHFAATITDTKRTHHSLNTKWKNMNHAMGVFNGLYIQQDYVSTIFDNFSANAVVGERT